MQYRIDYMKDLELKSTVSLIREVFDEFNKDEFDDIGIGNFYSFIENEKLKKRIDAGDMVVLVARTEFNQIIGMIAVSAQNQIDLLFVDRDFQRKGIGTNLLKSATNICKYNDSDLEKITVNSLKFSVDFYHKYGFKDLDGVQTVGGITFIPMAWYSNKEQNVEETVNSDNGGTDEPIEYVNDLNDNEKADIDEEDNSFIDFQIEESSNESRDFFDNEDIDSVIDESEKNNDEFIDETGILNEVEVDENDLYNILNEYYSQEDESERLKKNRAGIIEFITTNTYIQEHLCAGDRIIEIGAGTGIYSNYYAEQGYRVDAVELVESNFKKLKQMKNKNLRIHKANATNLSMFEDNTFDITLCLGPMYHLFSEEDRKQAISEAIRITKQYGKILFAYMTNETVIINHFLKGGNLIKSKELHNEEFVIKNDPNKVFYVSTISDIKNEIKQFNVKFLNMVATDGMAGVLSSDVEDLDDENFEEFINYHLATCERKDLIGYSSHVLFVCEKN